MYICTYVCVYIYIYIHYLNTSVYFTPVMGVALRTNTDASSSVSKAGKERP